MDLSAVGAREGVEVGPLLTLVDLLTTGLSPTGDHTLRTIGDDRLEAQAVLILAQQLYLRRRG